MMVYLRAKKIKGKTYYYAVEGSRDDDGKVKQRVVKYLGAVENILEKFKFWEKHHRT
jgi:hypothetical protein